MHSNLPSLCPHPAADDIPQGSNSCNLQWVTKWVDYSNKYGFGYQLSDHTVGVLFNNGTHMSLLPDRKYALLFHNAPPPVWKLFVTTCNGYGLFKHAVVHRTTLKNLLWDISIKVNGWLDFFEYFLCQKVTKTYHPKVLLMFRNKPHFQSRIQTDFKCQANPLMFGSCCLLSICFSHSLPLFRTIHYYAELGQRTVFPTCEVPEHFVGQVTVLKYFSHYMEENLMDVS